jgi:hypothetical protein
VPRNAITLAVASFAAAILGATALASASARPKPGHYAGRTSEQGKVTFKVADSGRRITGFAAVDGYNMKCHFLGTPPHIFHYTVKVPLMQVKSGGSFTGTAKATEGPFTGTFRVRGRFSSGKARGAVTRLKATCGSGASNPRTSPYSETFTAKRT